MRKGLLPWVRRPIVRAHTGAAGLCCPSVIPAGLRGSTGQWANGPTGQKAPNNKHQSTDKSQVPNDKPQTSRGEGRPASSAMADRVSKVLCPLALVPGLPRPRRSDTVGGASSFRSLESWYLLFVWDLSLEIWSFAGPASCPRQPASPGSIQACTGLLTFAGRDDNLHRLSPEAGRWWL